MVTKTIKTSAKSGKKLKLVLCISPFLLSPSLQSQSCQIWNRPTKKLKNQYMVTLISLILVFGHLTLAFPESTYLGDVYLSFNQLLIL